MKSESERSKSHISDIRKTTQFKDLQSFYQQAAAAKREISFEHAETNMPHFLAAFQYD
ncbi:MAG: hypothetical protein ACOX04_05515 [Candidatus Scatomorpha sp.]|jgi:hypothetical protein